ncbi:MAG: hypothetical protein K0R71_2112 [Bacillales bacterium]|jgi:serine protease Do|nr:hypothetical protein [Bacillales bacterium]
MENTNQETKNTEFNKENPLHENEGLHNTEFSEPTYYSQNQTNSYRHFVPESKVRKQSLQGYFFTGFLGVVVGALLVYFSLGLFNDSSNTSESKLSNFTGKNDGNVNVTKVSLDVTTAVIKASEKASKSVVGISNIQQGFFNSQSQEAGTGSGVIYKVNNGKAYIVTNAHVVEGANSLEVTMQGGEKRFAQLVGVDYWTDLAVITMEAKKNETIAEFGNSDTLKQGEPVIAIGNPLGLRFSGTVTEGIISGLNRTVPVDINEDSITDWNAEVLQTDAAINPGNSGGALVNMNGDVIGINSMKISQNAVEGIGLSIPINTVEPVIYDLEKFGKVKRPYMGTGLQSLNEISTYDKQQTLGLPKEVEEGVLVTSVEKNSPAETGGLKAYDVIVELTSEKTPDLPTLRKVLYSKVKIGEKAELKVYRNGKIETVTITFGEANISS